MRYKAPKGTQDLIFDRAGAWLEFVARAERGVSAYGYEPIQTPIFESTELFTRSVGETSDVASKELFSVRSMGAMQAMREGATLKGDQVLSLRPEGTAGVVRAIAEHALGAAGCGTGKALVRGADVSRRTSAEGTLSRIQAGGSRVPWRYRANCRCRDDHHVHAFLCRARYPRRADDTAHQLDG